MIARIFGFALVLVAGVFAVAIIYLALADFGRFKPQIENAVAKATGREFRIDGDLQVRALPSPQVYAEGVTLTNAAWGSEREMVEVGHFSMRIGLWSLLRQPVVIDELRLEDVSVLLEENVDAEVNWEMGEPSEEEMAEVDTETESDRESGETIDDVDAPVVLRHAEISNVQVRYRAPDAEDVTVLLEGFTVATDEAGRQAFGGSGSFSGVPFTLRGTTTAEDSELAANYGGVRLTSSMRYLANAVNFEIELGSLNEVGKLVDVEGLPAENLTLAGRVSLHSDAVLLSDIVAGLADARVTVNGEIDSTATAGQFSVEAEGSSLTVFSPDLPAIPFSAAAEVGLSEAAVVDIRPFEFTFGESDITGTLHAEGGDTTVVKLAAQASLVDLTPFTATGQEGRGAESPAAAHSTDAVAAGDSSPYLFRDEPLPLDVLEGLAVDVDLRVERLETGVAGFVDYELTATARNGKVKIENTFRGEYGGRYDNRLDVTTSGDRASVQIATNASDLKLGMLSGPDVPPELIPASDIAIDLTASGATPRALASSTDGRVIIRQGAGRVANNLIDAVSGDVIAQLFSALNPFSRQEQYTNWECSVLAIDFESGAGDISGFLLQSEKLMIVGGGGIDLNNERLNVEFNTKPRSGVGVSADMFVTPFVKLGGTLASPSVGLNQKGVLLEGGAAVLTGGLSFLYKGVMDRATAEADQCAKVLESIGEQASDAG